MTRDMARETLRRYGMTLVKTAYGEWRVNFMGGKEASAYYTTDLKDAVDTGMEMARRAEGRRRNPRRKKHSRKRRQYRRRRR